MFLMLLLLMLMMIGEHDEYDEKEVVAWLGSVCREQMFVLDVEMEVLVLFDGRKEMEVVLDDLT